MSSFNKRGRSQVRRRTVGVNDYRFAPPLIIDYLERSSRDALHSQGRACTRPGGLARLFSRRDRGSGTLIVGARTQTHPCWLARFQSVGPRAGAMGASRAVRICAVLAFHLMLIRVLIDCIITVRTLGCYFPSGVRGPDKPVQP